MKKIFTFAAICAALVACSKIEQPETAKDNQMILSASFEETTTKVTPSTLDGSTIVTYTWEADDKIHIVPTGKDTLEYTVVAGSISGSSASFSGTAFDVTDGYTVLYKGNTTYIENSFKPYARTAGVCSTSTFSLVIQPVLKLELQEEWSSLDSTVIYSIQYGEKADEVNYTNTFSFGSDGLDLSTGAKIVYVPLDREMTGIALKINYKDHSDTGEKEITSSTEFSTGKIFTMPTIEACLAAGTRITMADGSTKKIEDIIEGDMVRTFDHESGRLSSQKICLTYKGEEKSTPLNLTFASGKTLSIVGTHDVLCKETLKYVRINSRNVKSYVGKQFYNAEAGAWDELVSYEMCEDPVEYYCIYSAYHLNCIAEGMLTSPDDVDFLLNIYELAANLKADPVQLAADIQKYGLRNLAEDYPEYAEFAGLWNQLLFKYTNIALGKGLVTEDQLYGLRSYWDNIAQ